MERLGAAGLRKVYRARVRTCEAMKVVPKEMSADRESKLRFERSRDPP